MTVETPRLLLSCSFGDPGDGKTWSGTPRNIMRGLEEQGIAVETINSDSTRLGKVFALSAQRLLGRGSDYRRAGAFRSACADRVEEAAARLGIHHILHMGSLDVPLHDRITPLKHYLYCDATWNAWRKHAAGVAAMPAQAVQQADELERQVYARVEHIFSVSAYVRDDLTGHYRVPPERVSVVGTGRGSIRPYAGPKNYATGPILFVGRARLADKGCPLLIDAFRIAVAKKPDLRLVIVGPSELKPLEKQVPNLTVAVNLPWAELEALFQQAALFAQPAPNEPWGLVFLEALVNRTPVLGLRRNALPEITGNGASGFLVDTPTPEAVAEKILEAYANPHKLEVMGQAGQDYCLKTFSWTATTRRIADDIFPNRMPPPAPVTH